MSRATLPGPISPAPPAKRLRLRHPADGSASAVPTSAKPTTWRLAGGLGALFGLYLYVELVQAESVYVRDALAGLLIGGSLGVFLNAYSPVPRRCLAQAGPRRWPGERRRRRSGVRSAWWPARS